MSVGDRGTVIQKYGGTSLTTRADVEKVARHIHLAHRRGQRIVACPSAQGNMTDELKAKIMECGSDVVSPRLLDFGMSKGEGISAACLASAVGEFIGDDNVVVLDGQRIVMIVKGEFGEGKIETIENTNVIIEALDNGKVVIVAPYSGIKRSGEIITLGRGGSDTFAVAIAAALGCACEIYTDVPAIFAADPRKVPGARAMSFLTYLQVLDMTLAGASVLHDRAAQMADSFRVPVYIRLSPSKDKSGWSPASLKGTEISVGATLQDMEALGISQTCLTDSDDYVGLTFANLPNKSGMLETICGAFENTDIGDISQALPRSSADKAVVSFRYHKDKDPEVTKFLQQIKIRGSSTRKRKDLTTLTLVDRAMIGSPGWLARVTRTLGKKKINIQAMNSAGSTIWVMIAKSESKKAAMALAKEFGLLEQ